MAMSMGSFATRTVATVVVATDGTGDFTDIQTGIDSLPATGGVVYIKEGTYVITSTITINKNYVRLEGAGFATIIFVANGADVTAITINAGATINGIVLANFKIDGNFTNQTLNTIDGIDASSYLIISSIFENLYITSIKRDCIRFGALSEIMIRNCTLEYPDANAITANSAGINSALFVISNRIDMGVGEVGGVTAIDMTDGFAFVLTGNIIEAGEGPTTGINMTDCGECILTSNIIRDVNGIGIDVTDASNNIINSNVIDGSSNIGIRISAGSDETIVVGNALPGNLTDISDAGARTQLGHNITT